MTRRKRYRGGWGQMGDAIGEILPLAVALACGPLPIIAVVLILVSGDRVRTASVSSSVRWSGHVDRSRDPRPDRYVSSLVK
jgi:hypothetical protein